eukprot:TRINITY_DN87265_c0_g1_i1.p1 TRINITY_DN87265_c0_g1~~TRINITY_DN87265_c0_g1_i1.p1  ORF type:complete len:822 (+),score=91.47 TRINITY_DN87265_c0_g1_i1:158-2467(+)
MDDDALVAWCSWAKETFEKKSPHDRNFSLIDLSKNEIGDRGCRELVRLLFDLGAGVRVLKLQSNKLGRASAFAIAALLRSPRMPMHELHLSHNFIDKEGVMELLKSVAIATTGETPAYPLCWKKSYNSQGPKFHPLWIRFEHNIIEGGAALVRAAEKDARGERMRAGFLRQSLGTPLFCCVDDKLGGCKPSHCEKQSPEGPLAHICYISNSRYPMTNVPKEAKLPVRDGWRLAEAPKQEQITRKEPVVDPSLNEQPQLANPKAEAPSKSTTPKQNGMKQETPPSKWTTPKQHDMKQEAPVPEQSLEQFPQLAKPASRAWPTPTTPQRLTKQDASLPKPSPDEYPTLPKPEKSDTRAKPATPKQSVTKTEANVPKAAALPQPRTSPGSVPRCSPVAAEDKNCQRDTASAPVEDAQNLSPTASPKNSHHAKDAPALPSHSPLPTTDVKAAPAQRKPVPKCAPPKSPAGAHTSGAEMRAMPKQPPVGSVSAAGCVPRCSPAAAEDKDFHRNTQTKVADDQNPSPVASPKNSHYAKNAPVLPSHSPALSPGCTPTQAEALPSSLANSSPTTDFKAPPTQRKPLPKCAPPTSPLAPLVLLSQASWLSAGCIPGEVWGLVTESDANDTTGYLQLVAGDAVNIQFLGASGTDDGGFAYGRKLLTSSDSLEEGWFSCRRVAILPPSLLPDMPVGVFVGSPANVTIDRGALSNAFCGLVITRSEEGVGYLGMTPGDLVLVLFIGAEDTENAGYCYCKTPRHTHGWIKSSTIISWLPNR